MVYANYGRPEDIKRLKQMGISLKDKVMLVRYGQNFRGVKAEVVPVELPTPPPRAPVQHVQGGQPPDHT